MGRHNNHGKSSQHRNNWSDVNRGTSSTVNGGEEWNAEQAQDDRGEWSQSNRGNQHFGGSSSQAGPQGADSRDYQDTQNTQRGGWPEQNHQLGQVGQGGYAAQQQRYSSGNQFGNQDRGQGAGPYGYPQSGASNYPQRGNHGGFAGESGYRDSGQGGYSNQGGYGPRSYEESYQSGYGNPGTYSGQGGYGNQNVNQGGWDQGNRGQSYDMGGFSGIGGAKSGRGQLSQGYQADTGHRRGTPPRTYKRTDDRICEDVCERLMGDGLECDNVDVVVKDGIVRLTGEIKDRADKHRMEHIAANVSGVQDVDNQIKLTRKTGAGGESSGRDKDENSRSKADSSGSQSLSSSSGKQSDASGYGNKK